MGIAILLIIVAALSRVFALKHPELLNFSPMMALAFCGAIYLKRPYGYLIPFFALLVSDLYLNHYYGVSLFYVGMIFKYLSFAAAFMIGLWVAKNKSWTAIFGGAFGASILFYLITNSYAWVVEPGYAKSLAGWWQALTIGLPGFAPTWSFFRHSLTSDLLFVASLSFLMEWIALRAGQNSLFGKNSGERLARS